MSELKDIIGESVTRLFAEQVNHGLRSRAEQIGPPMELWQLCSGQGFDQVLVSEAHGGAGGSWTDAAPVIRACGEYAVPLPIPEALAARWLLSRAGIAAPAGLITLLPRTFEIGDDGRVTGTLDRVPWGLAAANLVGTARRGREVRVVLLRSGDLQWQPGANLAAEPRDSASVLAEPAAQAAVELPADLPRHLGALIRSGQLAGAAQALLGQSVAYAGDRRQFGRPLAQFQVIQHNLARLAGAVASMNAAAAAAFRAAEVAGFGGRPGGDARLAIAIAKCRTAEVTETVTGIAHQVHGAMGFTAEHGMHFWTRRMWSWRSEFGAAGAWAEWLGSVALRRGPARTWNDLSAVIGH